MKTLKLPIFALILASVACNKNTTTPDPVVPDKYMSFSSGSSWNYRQLNNLTSVTTNYVVSSTTRDSIINGKTYHVFTNSNTGGNEYYYTTGNDYFTYRLLGALGNAAVEDNYLKDNAPVNFSWSQAYNISVPGVPFAVPVTVTYTIKETGISRTVNGIAYTDVIHSSGVITSALVPSASLVTDIQNYFARKYGMIETRNKLSLNFMGITQNVDNTNTLVSAVIK